MSAWLARALASVLRNTSSAAADKAAATSADAAKAEPGAGTSVPVEAVAAPLLSHAPPAGWLPQPSVGVRIVAPAVEVPATEYDAHLDALILAAPEGSAECDRLIFAKRKGWCVERDGTRIFTRGRF